MSETTPNLGLFKYNTETDGKETFSIQTALNNNWDILDNAISSTSSLGQSGYMKFNNGLTINYGQASISSQERTWVTPVLNSLTTYGTISQTGTVNSVWNIFNDATTLTLFPGQKSNDIIWEFPTRVTFTNFHIEPTWAAGTCNPITEFYLYKLDSQNEWQLAASKTFTINQSHTYDATLTNFSTTKIKLTIGTSGTAVNGGLKRCLFTGTETTYAINSITFPCAFTTTNYAYSLAYLNGVFGDSYATTLTNAGMSIQNNSTADAVYYLAIGY